MAQVCNGSLGDPVEVINFGAGANPGPAISNVPSAYQYTSQDCPQEGFYALRTSTFFCFNNNWHTVPFDHTANDPNGYFLLINALAGPSDLYLDTITGLCPNNQVQAEAWVINLLKNNACGGNGTDPNLTFFITDMAGNIIAQKNTGDLPETDPYTWTSHNFLFTAPANGSVILKIRSNAISGCGNEFAIDDISFRPCGPSINSAFVNNTATQLVVCETNQQNIPMSASYSGTYLNPVFQWQVSYNSGFSWSDIPGANSVNYTSSPAPIGEYWYRCWVSDASISGNAACRFASNSLKIQITSPPFAQATNYVFGCYGSTVILFAAGGSSYEWTGPNGFFSNIQGPSIPNVNFSHTGDYIVKVTSSPGCFAYDTTTITIYAAPIATLSPTSINICEGDSVQLNAGGSLRYRWSPSTGLSNDTIPDPFAKPTTDITYTVRVFNEYTCYDTAFVTVKVFKKPKAFAGPDQFFRKNKPVQLNGNVTGTNVTYNWTPPLFLDNPNALTPIARPTGTITYTLNVRSNVGCGTSTDDVTLEIIDKLFIPNAFTPNGDGLNDKWEIITFDEYENATVEVYNRWGQRIYSGTGKNYTPWNGTYNGKPVTPGTYVYLVNLKNGKPLLKGTLNLIR